MATRTCTVHVSPDAYDGLVHEAERRGVAPDALADELVKADLAPAEYVVRSGGCGCARDTGAAFSELLADQQAARR